MKKLTGTWLLPAVLLLGGSVLLYALAANISDIESGDQAGAAVLAEHTLVTALELYYADNGYYPQVSGGVMLVDTLRSEGYLRGVVVNPDIFFYEAIRGGQEYVLRPRSR